MKAFVLFFSFLLSALSGFPGIHNDTIPKQVKKQRLILLGVGVNTIYLGSMITLNEIWYKNTPRSGFHFFNDNRQWMQVDKVGHFTTAFHESVLAIHALRWAGLTERKAVWLGSLAGFVYQTPIEYFDGRSPKYGASWGDIVANTAGSALVLGQHLLWKEVRIQPKFSFHRTSLAPQRPNVLGSNLPEEILKDYNGQTYWLSANLSSFLQKDESGFPRWLNVALGYGGHNMVYADKTTNLINGYKSYRQYYLSLDIDFAHVKTKKKWLQYVLYPLNIIHIPFPALEFSKKGLTFHPLYF